MVQCFLGCGLCEKAERQGVEQKRCEEPLRWYAVWPFFRGFLQLAHVTYSRQYTDIHVNALTCTRLTKIFANLP